MDARVGVVPDVPSATEAYAWAWPVLTRRFVELLLVAIVWCVLASPAHIAHSRGARLFAALYFTFVVVPLNFGALKAYLHAVRDEAPRVSHLFEPFGRAYPQIVLAHVLWMVLVGAGFAMLIVPGIIIATRLSFVGFLVMDERLDAMTAIRESWRRTDGHGGTLFVMWLLSLPLVLLGLMAFGVGIVPAIMWAHLAFAIVFDEVTDDADEVGAES